MKLKCATRPLEYVLRRSANKVASGLGLRDWNAYKALDIILRLFF